MRWGRAAARRVWSRCGWRWGDATGWVDRAGEAAQADGWVHAAQVDHGEVLAAGDQCGAANPLGVPGDGATGGLPTVEDQRQGAGEAHGVYGGGEGVGVGEQGRAEQDLGEPRQVFRGGWGYVEGIGSRPVADLGVEGDDGGGQAG
jgi:hypothetical protein